MYVYIASYIYIYIYLYVVTCLFIYIYMCIYLYIYIHIYLYTHVYIHEHIWTRKLSCSWIFGQRCSCILRNSHSSWFLNPFFYTSVYLTFVNSDLNYVMIALFFALLTLSAIASFPKTPFFPTEEKRNAQGFHWIRAQLAGAKCQRLDWHQRHTEWQARHSRDTVQDHPWQTCFH